MAITKDFIPHTELKASDLNELVAQVNAYIAEINATLEAAIASSTSGIERQATQSEEQAIIYETDGGTQVGKIDSTGADFINLKRGGQQVARMSDLPTKDSSIGENPSTTNVPTTKAVKDYVDAKQIDLPITKGTTASEAEELEFSNDAGSQSYAKVGSYGIKSKAYLDMSGNNVIPTKDTSIGDTPSTTNVPTTKAVKDYVDAHGGGDLPIDKETTQSEDEEIRFETNGGNLVGKINSTGADFISLKLNGQPITGLGRTLANKKVLIIGDSISHDSTSVSPAGSFGGYEKWVANCVQDGFFTANKVTNDSHHASGFVAYTGHTAGTPFDTTDPNYNTFITRLQQYVNNEYDLIILFGGINDFIQCVKMGDNSGETSITEYFKPAVDYFFDYLVKNFLDSRIVVFSPLLTSNLGQNTIANKTSKDYINYIKQVAQYYCLPVFNLTEESGFMPFINEFCQEWTRKWQGVGDGIHPNADYYIKFLTPMIKNYLLKFF